MIKSDKGKVTISGSDSQILSEIRDVLSALYEEGGKDMKLFFKYFFTTLNPRYNLQECERIRDRQFNKIKNMKKEGKEI